jgi:hypothetical protein
MDRHPDGSERPSQRGDAVAHLESHSHYRPSWRPSGFARESVLLVSSANSRYARVAFANGWDRGDFCRIARPGGKKKELRKGFFSDIRNGFFGVEFQKSGFCRWETVL